MSISPLISKQPQRPAWCLGSFSMQFFAASVTLWTSQQQGLHSQRIKPDVLQSGLLFGHSQKKVTFSFMTTFAAYGSPCSNTRLIYSFNFYALHTDIPRSFHADHTEKGLIYHFTKCLISASQCSFLLPTQSASWLYASFPISESLSSIFLFLW